MSSQPPATAAGSFVHLHCHTHYSLLDGANRIPDLVGTAKSMGMPAIAITDHGNMFGAIEFYLAAQKAGIKPILGFEAYIAPGDRRSKDAKGMSEASYHLLLLAQDMTGYRNLIKLTSIGYMEGFYYKPRIDREVLAAHSAGLICTSTCLGAEIPQALMKHDRATAEQVSDWYLSIFGPERFFIELQDHGIEEQRQINPELIEIAQRKGVGLVATNDVHYLRHDDVEAHDILCCISTRSLQSDEKRFKFPSNQFYLKTPAEMAALFPQYPEAVSNTLAIAERCNVEIDFKKRYTPVYRPPGNKTDADYLRELVYQGARERYGSPPAKGGPGGVFGTTDNPPPLNSQSTVIAGTSGAVDTESSSRFPNTPPGPPLSGGVKEGVGLSDELRERIDYELGVIQSKGFSSYFLICWDFVHYARGEGIPAGARGSGCSSVVAHCLYLSQPDPIRYGLYFERFMDPDRNEMPDIDIDICQDGREQVLRYVRDKYGHVAQIITFGSLKARAVIRDVCRVLGVPLADADRLAKMVPEALGMTLEKALAQEPDLKRQYDEDRQIRKVIDVGRRLEGLARNPGIHAAGVVVADQPLDELLPLYRPAGTDQVVTQFEGSVVEKVGLLKMDFLGLRTLSVLALSCKLIEQNHGVKMDLEALDLTDEKVYRLFAAGQTKGVFQFESGGMRDVLMRMRPNRIEDLIAANALYRPGPMQYIDPYVHRKHGEAWQTPHPIMTEVLNETYGIIVYQEQVARLANLLGGIERKRAFRLAKAISKKKTDMIEAEREPFLEGAEKNGLKRAIAEDIFNQILPFGEYAFNKAHSTGYALVAYQTAYLKSYYPLEFMAASLTYEMGDTEKVVEYIEECRRLDIDVKPPDINSSDVHFTVVREKAISYQLSAISQNSSTAGPPSSPPPGFLRFGLAAIKGVGERAVEHIVKVRDKGGPFKDLFDFCERIDLTLVNKGVIEALVKAGAFDTTGAMRKGLILALESAMQAASLVQRDRSSGQLNMFGAFEVEDAQRPASPIPAGEWTEAEMLAHEKSVLGFYVTKHPLASHADDLERFASADCRDLSRLADGQEVVLGGMITRIRSVLTKTGRRAGSKMAVLTFEDLTGSTEAVVFSEDLEKYRDLIAPDALVFLRGTVDRKREEPSVRVSEVIAKDAASSRLAQLVLLRVNGLGLERPTLEALRGICGSHGGRCPVFVRLFMRDDMITVVRASSRLSVEPSETFKSAVESLLGAGAVEIMGVRKPRRRAGLPAEPEADEPPAARFEEAIASPVGVGL